MPINAVHPHTNDTLTANLAGASFVIAPRFGESYSFDRAGRLLAVFLDERSYQRALDGRVLERLRNREGSRRRQPLPDEQESLLARVASAMHDLADSLADYDLTPGDHTLLADALALILDFGPERLASDGAAYRRLYKPVSILPPDQYLALVLQATEGCSWNRCTFCGLYRDRNFRIHSPESFREHCAGVRDFFGAGLSLRRGLFLADANALVTPMPRLRAYFEIAQEFFALPEGLRPVYSFVSAFDVDRKSAAEWGELHALGLDRAYIGLETGDDTLLRFLNKPGTVQDAIEAVAALRAGGVSVGVILMAGIGGDHYAVDHVARSVAAVEAMSLGARDQVYLSNYVSAPGTEYDDRAAQAGIRALTPDEVNAQLQTMQAQIRAVVSEAKVVPYRVDGFAV